MRFSIVTITRNSERYLEETLRSVERQEFHDFEHLIWDGGSTDRTLEIARSYPKVKIFQGSDSGISDAMNKGAEKARGDFLIHLHSDDLLAHPKVLTYVDTFLKQHPTARWVYGMAEFIDENGVFKKITSFTPFSSKRLRKYNTITHPAVVLARGLFQASGGFRTDLRYCMDYELWLRLAKGNDALAMPITVAKFREHNQSLSTKEGLGVTDEAYKVRNEYVQGLLERFQSYRTWRKRRKKNGYHS